MPNIFGDEALESRSGPAVNAFGDPITGTTPATGRRAQDLGDAIIAGLQNSATGLAIRGKLPSMELGADAPWHQRLASNAAGVAADIPLSIVGAMVGGPAGQAAIPVPGAGAAIGAGAGAFAAPMALRDALIEAYNNDHALSWSGAWEIGKAAIGGAAKGAVIGGATVGAGRIAAPLLAPAGKVAAGVGAVGVELSALTAASAAVNQHMPTWQDFMDNAILLGGMKAAVAVAGGLRNTYAETGKLPGEVLADAERNPGLKSELTGEPTFTQKQIKDAGGFVMGVSEVAKQGDGGQSPWLMVDGKIVGTGQDHIAFADAITAGAAGDYSGFMKQTGAVRASFFFDKDVGFTATLHLAEGQQLSDAQVATLRSLEKARGAPLSVMIGRADGLVNPEYKPIPLESLQPGFVPAAYQGVALAQRINAAIDADPRPEMIRSNIARSADPAKFTDATANDPVKYEYISDSATAKGVLRQVTDMYQAEITAQTRGVVPNKQTAMDGMKMATDGVLDPHVVGQAGNAAEIYARAHILKGATNSAVQELAKIANIPEAELSPANKLQALAALERVAMLKAEIEGVGAEAGRALQIFRAMKRDPSLLGEAETLLKIAERKGNLQDIAKMAAQMKDPASMAEFARQYTKATTMQQVMEAWKAGLLSGPQTHLANVMGNSAKWLMDIPESAVSATFTAAERAMKGDPLTMEQFKARALAPLYGLQFGARDALTVAAEVWRGSGESLEKGDVYQNAIPGEAGKIVRLPFKALQVEDALFRTPAERAEAHIMAVDRATKQGLNPQTAEYRESVVQWTARPELGLSDAAGLKAIERVQQAGAEGVFSQRLGPRMEIMSRAVVGSPAEFVVPFRRTPVNLISWAVQHVPGLNIMSGRWRDDFAAGGEARSKAVARVVIGTGITMTAYSLASSGLLTGSGLFDKDEGGTKRAAGWQPSSIKIGDKFYSYQRMEPVAKVIGLAADLIELQNATKDPEDKAKIAGMLVMVFGNATVSTTYLSGLSNLINGVVDPERYGGALMEQYASSLVPKIVGQPTTMADPYKREVDGALDSIQSQLPFLREKLLPKRDVWGEPASNERWFAVMPIATSEESKDMVRTEAARLHLAIADAPKYIQEKGPFNPSDKRIKLEPEQRDIFREVAGKNAMNILTPIVNAPDWAAIPDFAKAEIYKKVIEGTRKQGSYAALPPDDAARVKLREEIVNRVIKETQAAGSR